MSKEGYRCDSLFCISCSPSFARCTLSLYENDFELELRPVSALCSLPFVLLLLLLSLSFRSAVDSGARDGRFPGPSHLDAAAMEEEEEGLRQLQRWGALPIGSSRRKVAQAPSPPRTGCSFFGSELDAVAVAEEVEVPMWSSRAT